jgi:hypothetical protein
MILDLNATIRYKNGYLSSNLAFEMGLLTLNIDGYILENNPSFSQHWEISQHSFNEFGNKPGFDLTGFNYEITNFELEFKYKPYVLEQNLLKEIELTFLVKYSGVNQELILYNADKSIEIKENSNLEKIFQQLDKALTKSKQHLKSCFGCALSGYEKGGTTLFCMKKSSNLFLSKPYAEQYQRHFTGLEKEVVAEFYRCNQFEIDTRKNKN